MDDSLMAVLMFAGLGVHIVLSYKVGVIAMKRGYSQGRWMLLALLISSPLALLFLIASPARAEEERIRCPECAEPIMHQAKLCPFCHSTLTPITAREGERAPAAREFRSGMNPASPS